MQRVRRLALACALLAALPALAEDAPSADAVPAGDVVSLRFAWPAVVRAKVTYRRTRARTGDRPKVFVARYETRAESGEGGVIISTRGTSWRGDLPFPAAMAKEAIDASEQVVQRIEPDGEFAGLEGADALRPVLARLFEEAKVPPDEAQRVVSVAEAAMRREAEELWNLAVGFWTGADLAVGETYALESEGELPLLPGVRARQATEFSIRRRVPCAAGERAERCVEATLRSVPDRAALEAAAGQLLPRISPGGEPHGDAKDLAAESELVLVTDPATLLPRRLVWTKAVRLRGDDDGPPRAEQVDRSEYDYRWLPTEPPPRRAPPRRPPPPPASAAPQARAP